MMMSTRLMIKIDDDVDDDCDADDDTCRFVIQLGAVVVNAFLVCGF
jgi:hypothetical protein